uniref:PH domain-containing protein n=1 Tax=Chromera velia CCMP2878 TaxID=1169474 RepID=A0A0G4G0Q5_9ALVE|eukprot:Cvel_19699.t1-p1 / transcript=Cvel_19699.t1 / gene=Cvel_19699 / organism=Chromera_velia_CCMP2878 / gene_product=hypothetical protein / transcript_product=hypothetical protein / location=Cvel_scaffold1719:11810-34589(+) / protein_length=1762 / sequence_SO=supercontig / SO=protein_coding / is_pseudo=false
MGESTEQVVRSMWSFQAWRQHEGARRRHVFPVALLTLDGGNLPEAVLSSSCPQAHLPQQVTQAAVRQLERVLAATRGVVPMGSSKGVVPGQAFQWKELVSALWGKSPSVEIYTDSAPLLAQLESGSSKREPRMDGLLKYVRQELCALRTKVLWVFTKDQRADKHMKFIVERVKGRSALSVERKGLLLKRGRRLSRRIVRFYELHGDDLFCFNTQTCSSPKKRIHIPECFVSACRVPSLESLPRSRSDKTFQHNCIKLVASKSINPSDSNTNTRSNNTYFLYAESEEALQHVLEHIHHRCRPKSNALSSSYPKAAPHPSSKTANLNCSADQQHRMLHSSSLTLETSPEPPQRQQVRATRECRKRSPGCASNKRERERPSFRKNNNSLAGEDERDREGDEDLSAADIRSVLLAPGSSANASPTDSPGDASATVFALPQPRPPPQDPKDSAAVHVYPSPSTAVQGLHRFGTTAPIARGGDSEDQPEGCSLSLSLAASLEVDLSQLDLASLDAEDLQALAKQPLPAQRERAGTERREREREREKRTQNLGSRSERSQQSRQRRTHRGELSHRQRVQRTHSGAGTPSPAQKPMTEAVAEADEGADDSPGALEFSSDLDGLAFWEDVDGGEGDGEGPVQRPPPSLRTGPHGRRGGRDVQKGMGKIQEKRGRESLAFAAAGGAERGMVYRNGRLVTSGLSNGGRKNSDNINTSSGGGGLGSSSSTCANNTNEMEKAMRVDVHRRLSFIHDLVWDFQLTAAERELQTFEEEEGENSQAALIHLEVALFRALVSGRRTDLEAAWRRALDADRLREGLQRRLRNVKGETLRLLSLRVHQSRTKEKDLFSSSKFREVAAQEVLDSLAADALLFRSVLTALQGHRIEAFFVFRQAWLLLRRIEVSQSALISAFVDEQEQRESTTSSPPSEDNPHHRQPTSSRSPSPPVRAASPPRWSQIGIIKKEDQHGAPATVGPRGPMIARTAPVRIPCNKKTSESSVPSQSQHGGGGGSIATNPLNSSGLSDPHGRCPRSSGEQASPVRATDDLDAGMVSGSTEEFEENISAADFPLPFPAAVDMNSQEGDREGEAVSVYSGKRLESDHRDRERLERWDRALQCSCSSRFKTLLEAEERRKKDEEVLSSKQPPVDRHVLQLLSTCHRCLASRALTGLGIFYVIVSLVPGSIAPLLRLAGFVVDKERGRRYLDACAVEGNRPRAPLAALVLSLFHLDMQPDVERAGQLLTSVLERHPASGLPLWAASVLAWRHGCIQDAVFLVQRALNACAGDEGTLERRREPTDPLSPSIPGPEALVRHAFYLKYEMGWFLFMKCEWAPALSFLLEVASVSVRIKPPAHLCMGTGRRGIEAVHAVASCTRDTEKSVLLPTNAQCCLCLQVAACALMLGEILDAVLWLEACEAVAFSAKRHPSAALLLPSGAGGVESGTSAGSAKGERQSFNMEGAAFSIGGGDRAKVKEDFGKLAAFHRVRLLQDPAESALLLPFELLYLLKHFSRLPPNLLNRVHAGVCLVGEGSASAVCRDFPSGRAALAAADSLEASIANLDVHPNALVPSSQSCLSSVAFPQRTGGETETETPGGMSADTRVDRKGDPPAFPSSVHPRSLFGRYISTSGDVCARAYAERRAEIEEREAGVAPEARNADIALSRWHAGAHVTALTLRTAALLHMGAQTAAGALVPHLREVLEAFSTNLPAPLAHSVPHAFYWAARAFLLMGDSGHAVESLEAGLYLLRRGKRPIFAVQSKMQKVLKDIRETGGIRYNE